MLRLPGAVAGAMLWSAVAAGQVTTNQGALDALGKLDAPAPVRRPVVRPRPAAPATRSTPQAAAPQPAEPPPAKPPTVPVTPPAILALPPPLIVPLAHPPPEPVATVTEDAPGVATPIQQGIRVTFGADRSDLNPATLAALRAFASSVADQSRTSINIFAYASGTPDDPSTPRRLSLARALAARAVLLQAGIASPRIYPRALGPTGGDTDSDRIDVTTGSPTPPAAGPTAQGHAG